MFSHIKNKSIKKHTLNIVHIFSGDLWAGAEVMIFNLLSELKKFKHINLYAISLNKGTLMNKLIDKKINIEIVDEKQYPFIIILFKIAKILINIGNIDIIHSHRYKENLIAFLTKLYLKPSVKLISTMHGISEIEKGIKKIKDIANMWILRNFFITVSVSNELKYQLKNRKFSKVITIHNGINIPSYIPKSKNSIIHIGTVARLVKIKRLYLFLFIAKELKSKRSNLKFSILGDGPLKNRLILLAKSLGLEKDITFFSEVVNPISYYRSLDIYINTSLHEGIPMSILEAMACGNPVIAFKVGGIPEIVEDSKEGFMIENNNLKLFIEKILVLIDKPELRYTMGKRCREKIKNYFNATLMAFRYYNLYKNLIL